jgi:hypothetical protein
MRPEFDPLLGATAPTAESCERASADEYPGGDAITVARRGTCHADRSGRYRGTELQRVEVQHRTVSAGSWRCTDGCPLTTGGGCSSVSRNWKPRSPISAGSTNQIALLTVGIGTEDRGLGRDE